MLPHSYEDIVRVKKATKEALRGLSLMSFVEFFQVGVLGNLGGIL